MKYTIPRKVSPHPVGTLPEPSVLGEDDQILYEPVDGEMVHVQLWVRYPSYDFIFGVPDKASPRYGKEIAYFQFRRVGEAKHYGLYLDVKESEAMVAGFKAIIRTSKGYAPHLWQETFSPR